MSKLSDNLTEPSSEQSLQFAAAERKALLEIAHSAISSGIANQPLESAAPTYANMPGLSAALLAPRGVFTTLYLHGQLRGCVGYALPLHPLFRAVAETARAAAFQDVRFPPVNPAEARELKVSLSVLSPLYPILPDQVVVGRHGLIVSDGFKRGLLLPQVPVEHGWDRLTFLQQTCRKAGLPTDAWQSASIEAFTAEVFGDEDHSS